MRNCKVRGKFTVNKVAFFGRPTLILCDHNICHGLYFTTSKDVDLLLFGSVFGKRDLLAIFSQTRFQRNFPFKRCKPFKNIPDRI